MVIYILRYNSYFNRILKKEDSLLDYLTDDKLIYTESQLNFNPGDGCDTQFVAGRQGNSYDGSGDYLIYSEDGISITSRWFITEQTRNLKGQYTIGLHRDVLVDSYNEVIDAEMFVESAIIKDSDPLIYNSEPITVNQIKQDEKLLKDKTGCPWIVGYFDKTAADKEIKSYIEYTYDEAIDTTYDEWLKQYGTYYYKSAADIFKFKYMWKIGSNVICNELVTITNNGVCYSDVDKYDSTTYIYEGSTALDLEKIASEFVSNNIIEDLRKLYFPNTNDNRSYNGKVLRFKTNTEGEYIYKKINISSEYKSFVKNMSYGETINSLAYVNILSKYFSLPISTSSTQSYISVNILYNVTATDVTPGTYIVNFAPTKKILASDTPYGIFAIPYGNIKINNVDCDPAVSMDWAMKAYELAGGTSSSYIYDVQLLPFCPCQGWINSDGSMTISNDKQYSYIAEYDSSGTFVKNRSVIIYPNSQSFTLNIDYTFDIDNKKMSSVCDTLRLVSPNYNGQFEFTPAKNDGVVLFNVDCTYIPYNPYIHINPNFNGLYGKDYNDSRGLICQGDFSLPVMNDAWITYQNNNKNYQNIFNRQIENMEVSRKYQLIQETFDRINGVANAFSNGVSTGMKFGGKIGGIAGGIINAGVSFIGGQVDKQISAGLYNESVSYMKDTFALQLGNIQAQPQSIGKTTAFSFNNKIFPIVEYYSCTDKEKEYVANKIIYNSMNAGVVGKITDFIDNTWTYNNVKSKGFIKGKLLHADINHDSHYLATVSNELQLGEYFTWN